MSSFLSTPANPSNNPTLSPYFHLPISLLSLSPIIELIMRTNEKLKKELISYINEIKLLSTLQHPNIVNYIESFIEWPNMLYCQNQSQNRNLPHHVHANLDHNNPVNHADNLIFPVNAHSNTHVNANMAHFCMVMSYCNGGDLSSLLNMKKKQQQSGMRNVKDNESIFSKNKLNSGMRSLKDNEMQALEKEALYLFVQIALALLFVHQKKILHRSVYFSIYLSVPSLSLSLCFFVYFSIYLYLSMSPLSFFFLSIYLYISCLSVILYIFLSVCLSLLTLSFPLSSLLIETLNLLTFSSMMVCYY
jgi:serine/threonine protein kinase